MKTIAISALAFMVIMITACEKEAAKPTGLKSKGNVAECRKCGGTYD